ncbi:RnfABCDGE type electron transport complex subunit D [Caproiciproducens sp. MSJ-32]|uniref:RnfABCDGE type electron transport complex subunit D n=1 Tax=Caproiciproducens sp. MSJ-32 TaxID=2841527 RepID=UPI003FA410BF
MKNKAATTSKVDEMDFEGMLLVSSSPHIRSDETVQRIMLDVIIALIPAMIGSVYFFGISALKLILISVASSVLFEALIQKAFKREVTINDLSAVITGILIAFNLPANAPLWLPIIGSAFAIIIVKQFFGGLGSNFMNPALAARAMLLTSWPNHMSSFTGPRPDVITTATPLTIMKTGGTQLTGSELPSLMDMFVGNIPGAIGETSALLLLIGAIYLIIRQVIDWRIPVFYIGTTFIMLILLGVESEFLLYHILGGGLILGAFYMATDYASSPVTSKGRIIYGIGAGILTAIIRVKGGYPEGVSYSILLMNIATPIIEKITRPRVFGEVK